MKEYLFTLFGVGMVAAITRAVVFCEATKKHIELICALCLICAVVFPAVQAFTDIDSFDSIFDTNYEDNLNYDEICNSYLNEEAKIMSEKILSEELCDRFDKKKGSLSVKLSVVKGEQGCEIKGTTVTVGASAVDTDPRDIEMYLEERLGVECEIIYDIFNE